MLWEQFKAYNTDLSSALSLSAVDIVRIAVGTTASDNLCSEYWDFTPYSAYYNMLPVAEYLQKIVFTPSSKHHLLLKLHTAFAIKTIPRRKYLGKVRDTPSGLEYDDLCIWFSKAYKQLMEALSELCDNAQTTLDAQRLKPLSLVVLATLPCPRDMDTSTLKLESWLSTKELEEWSLAYNREFWDGKCEEAMQRVTSDEDKVA